MIVPSLKISKSKDQHGLEEQIAKKFGEIEQWMRGQQPAVAAATGAQESPTAPPFPTSAAAPLSFLSAQFVTVQEEPALPNSMVLTAGTNISINGATVSADGSGRIAKGQRVTTGSIAASTTTQVTLTWSAAFADANYTPVADVVDSTGFLQVLDIASFTASQVVVNVKNNDGASAHTGTLAVVGIHD